MNIIIKDEFETDYQTRAAGETLRKKILLGIKQNIPVSVDLTDIKIASVSFIDEGIIKLQDEDEVTSEFLSLLTLNSIYFKDYELFKSMIIGNSFFEKMKVNIRERQQ